MMLYPLQVENPLNQKIRSQDDTPFGPFVGLIWGLLLETILIGIILFILRLKGCY
jgi:hypothetical protein